MPYYSKDPLWRKRTVWIRHVEVMLCLKHFNLMVILSSGSDGGFAMHFMFNFLPWLSLLQNCQLAENDFLMTFSIPFLAYSKNCSSERFFRQQHIPTADRSVSFLFIQHTHTYVRTHAQPFHIELTAQQNWQWPGLLWFSQAWSTKWLIAGA